MTFRPLPDPRSLVAAIGILALAPTGGRAQTEDLAWLEVTPDLTDGPVTVRLHAPDGGVQGWSFGLCHESSRATLRWFRPSASLLTVRDGRPPSFLVTEEGSGERGREGVVQAVVLDTASPVELPGLLDRGFPVLEAEFATDDEAWVTVCEGLRGSAEPVGLSITIDGATYSPESEAIATIVPPPQAWFDIAPRASNGPVTVYINSAEGGIQGWSLALCHDASKASVRNYRSSPELMTVRHGSPPEFQVLQEADDGEQTGVIQAIVPAYTETIRLPGETQGGFPILEVEYDVHEETSVTFCGGLQGTGQPVALVVTLDGVSSRLPMQHASATLVVDPYSETLVFRAEPPESSEVVTVKLYSEEAAVEAWSFTLCHTAEAASVLELRSSPELERLVFGEAPEFVLNQIEPADPFVAVEQQVVIGSAGSGLSPIALGPFPDGLSTLDIRYDIRAEDHVKFCDHVGSLRFENHVTIGGVDYVPRTREGAVLVTRSLGSRFIRGDADLDTRLTVTDAILVLDWLFTGGRKPPCLDAADVNDVARVDISDAVYLLRYLFLGGPQPPPPFPDPGVDISSATSLGCERGV